MSSLTANKLPTRADLRAASPWFWLLLGLAVADAIFVIAIQGISPNALSSAALTAFPLIIAAELMLLAPGVLLLRISALCFAIPAIALALPEILLSSAVTGPVASPDNALLIPRLVDFIRFVVSFTWIFDFVAVMALALHVGRVATMRGWAIVGVAAVIGLAQLVVSASTWLDLMQLTEDTDGSLVVSSVVHSLAIVGVLAWGYFAAVTFERRLILLAVAGCLALVARALSVIVQVFVPTTGPDLTFQVQLAAFWTIAVASWLTLLAGIWLELPRHGQTTATDTVAAGSEEALSPGR